MNQTYRAAVPAIGFVQVWFSPALARFAENTFDVVSPHATMEAAHTFSEEPAEPSAAP
jgi:hypothetical protein